MDDENAYDYQLHRVLDWYFYIWHKHQQTDLMVLTIEKFVKEGRPLKPDIFKYADSEFTRKAVFITEIFWREDSYVDE
jgi:hypothetical protein